MAAFEHCIKRSPIKASLGAQNPGGNPAFPWAANPRGNRPRAKSPRHLEAHDKGMSDPIHEFSTGPTLPTSRGRASLPHRGKPAPPPLRPRPQPPPTGAAAAPPPRPGATTPPPLHLCRSLRLRRSASPSLRHSSPHAAREHLRLPVSPRVEGAAVAPPLRGPVQAAPPLCPPRPGRATPSCRRGARLP